MSEGVGAAAALAPADARTVFYAYFPLACFISDNTAAEKADPGAAFLEEELNVQFEKASPRVDLSRVNFGKWITLQALCAKLSKSDSTKSEILLDNCNLGRHGAVVVSRSFTHVFVRGGNYHAQWLPLMYQNSRIKIMR